MRYGNLRSWIKTVGSLGTAVALAACGEEHLQSTINPVTDYGEVSHHLYVQVFWWTMLILAVVWTLLAYILVRFRERPGQEKPRQIHGHMGLEIAWTIVPALIVVAIVIPTIKGVFQVQRAPDERRPGRGGDRQAVLVELPLSRPGSDYRQRAPPSRGSPREPASRVRGCHPLLLGPATGREARREPGSGRSGG